MKILYINALYSPHVAGGAEISLKLIVEGMQAKGHDVVVLSLVPEGGLSSDWVDGVKVYRVGLENRYWPFTEQRPDKMSRLAWHLTDRYNAAMGSVVGEVIRLERPTAVSCHNLVGWSIAVWDEVARAGLPMVQVLHDMYLLCANSNMYKGGMPCTRRCFSCRMLRYRHRPSSARVQAVVGISRSILDRFEAYGYFPGVPRHVIHNARAVPEGRPARARNDGDPLTVGYIGTLAPIKGVAWLIDAFKKTGVEGRLRIAGRGKAGDVEHFKALAAGDPRIDFVGYVAPQEFYRDIDVLVVPSLWEEPLGMVAVEGLANHLPVVASHRGGLKESVKDGHNGILCDPDNPDSLGHALAALWKDAALYNRLATAARPSVAEYLSVERMVNAYENVLHTLTAGDAVT
ncbi:Glycosyltransferase involved in cell wall bisynthesis [Parapedobacter composti]|uniref:Glycosyltransferase involved in cell wall bisynthesis n=1 Tax=Parapedobacter composti TaxID=623281 RepID=A0A1I1LQZ2_9SPHI|nr:glycosyltransferase family 4 protein [Parapedobacter composti]SFC75657.1 Glycosyltransferase involved in cell wall bisynthesis [Parapedobacter composti]